MCVFAHKYISVNITCWFQTMFSYDEYFYLQNQSLIIDENDQSLKI